MEVWPTDRVVMKSEDEEEPKPSLLLYCYRILGVPEPPPFKVKKQVSYCATIETKNKGSETDDIYRRFNDYN